MPKYDDLLKANNLEFVGYWDTTFFYKSNQCGGLILRDENKKEYCLTWDELKKLHRKLIAKYPTWQEAVNSKEFRE